jgi:thymidylate synthase
MNDYEEKYLDLLRGILEEGVYSKNRTGINTYKYWGAQMHINLQEGFPLLTTKKMHWKSVVHELLWMIKGDTNIQYLLKNGVTFWTEWPYQKYLNHCKTLTEPDYDVHIEDIEKNCVREMTQKEFEQEIINDDNFAKTWASIGEYGYGGMWRKFPFFKRESVTEDGIVTFGQYKQSVDQLTNAINELKNNPDSRRIIITAWHPYHSNNREDALLPACHNYIQFGTEELTLEERFNIFSNGWNVEEAKNEWNKNGFTDYDSLLTDHYIPKYRLNCYFNMRSSDTFLGLPFNCAFYALFTHLIANQLNMIPNQLVYSAADVHLYENHLEQVKLQLTRDIREIPRLNIKTPGKSIFDIKFEDIEILDYNPHPAIKGEVAV